MEHAAGPPSSPHSRAHAIASGPPDVAAERLAAAFSDPGASPAADREAVRALAASASREAVLDRLDLGSLSDLAERHARRLADAGASPSEDARRDAWALLDLLRRPSVLRRIQGDDVEAWSSRMLALVDGSHLTVGPLFRTRAETYGAKPLFQLPGNRVFSWRQVADRVETLSRGLVALLEGRRERVAILAENRIETALVDLACLTSGIVDIPIPTTATEADVGYILGHTGASVVIVSGREQLEKVVRNRERLGRLEHVVVMDPRATGESEAVSIDSIAARAHEVPPSEIERRALDVRIDDLATVMYTSGTTGTPKGIQFSQRNIVFKRFARALALPEVGEEDVFLCYLPLFHTFGRYLEMLGCVFWGATYCFLLDPSVEALVRGMRRFRPTAFISVPRKWIQIYEAIARDADPDTASDDEILDATRRITGGRLRWGLSAAGHLDSEMFRFFQQQGIELMSGFGMTEATGGISMTPPGQYRDDSLGVLLPGIEGRLDDDGELMVRGPYVMTGYLDPPDGAPSFDEEGWFRTGDLMSVDPDGHLRLVDRKKEIYKNIKGQTIAPQRVENMFRDFEAVRRVFLVGDHREYNTALIHPNPDYKHLDVETLNAEALHEHIASLVVSVNKFLPPYERIVDFAIIDRDLDAEREELTPKGTPRRKVVEQNFAEVIRDLYRRTEIETGGVHLSLPNWLFQGLGLTARDIGVEDRSVRLRGSGATLRVERVDEHTVRIGSCFYSCRTEQINLGTLLTVPRLWLGNEQLVRFVALDPSWRRGPGRASDKTRWKGRAEPVAADSTLRDRLVEALSRAEPDLTEVHLAAVCLLSDDKETAMAAVRLLEKVTALEDAALSEPARLVLARAADSPLECVRQRAFQVLVPAERQSRFEALLRIFLEPPRVELDEETRALLCERDLPPAKLEAFMALAGRLTGGETATERATSLAAALLRLLADYAASHPSRYRSIRAFLVQTMLFASEERIRRDSLAALDSLQDSFRHWLGAPQRIAVDPETGREYRWEDVVAFEDGAPEEDRQRILAAIQGTSMLREAVFLFSGGAVIKLSDVPPGGVWVRLLGKRHGKSVYRVTVQTRHQETYEVAVNLSHDMPPETVQEEILLLVLCGEPKGGEDPLVEVFGGHWKEQQLWSEEFVPGDTLYRALRRMARREKENERLKQNWPFFAWSAMSSFVDFWNRTGRRWEIADPAATSVIVPTHDFLKGARLVSLAERRPFSGLVSMIRSFRTHFVEPVENQYPLLRGILGWDVVFSSVLEVVGEDEGVAMLRGALASDDEAISGDLRYRLVGYLDEVESRGFLPMRLFFATKRYRRWERLSGDPTPQARARTLQEFYDTYGLHKLSRVYPEVRVRFFRETVFREAPEALSEGLEAIIARMRRGELVGDELIDAIADLRAQLDLGPDEDYFLARLSFPHLLPEDEAAFVRADLAGRHQSEMVVTLEDDDGDAFHVRHALTPKEVGRLHRLFLDANLHVQFRPEHQYLVAINDRARIIGGIYYEVEQDGHTAHLEKIVVAERYRKSGVARGLMNEFFNRLRAIGVRTATTGFFRPEYFYAYGFTIGKRYAGLVKRLDEPSG